MARFGGGGGYASVVPGSPRVRKEQLKKTFPPEGDPRDYPAEDRTSAFEGFVPG